MIDVTKLVSVLLALGYEASDDACIYSKAWPAFDASITVDIARAVISYPEEAGLKVNKHTTCNFSDNENFVVLECVTRLLDKGYRPSSLELEREWSLGHTQKSGRADICVSGEDGTTLAIIECKTAGTEFAHAWRDTQADGGQLFSYWQQERSCSWLVLYAADMDEKGLSHEVQTISCEDDANYVALAGRDDDVRLYVQANTAAELFAVWDETYAKASHDEVLLGPDARAYAPRLRPLRKRDLRPFTAEDARENKIVNRFEEILRHNNISDKENAFNRLIALFIAKLADELEKVEGDEVEFQYKQGGDTYESFQDRLQRLHQTGMQKFMREEVLYVPSDYAERLLRQYTGQRRAKMIDELNGTLRKLKFYTNSDFAFKDVHNEELFLQNGKVLVEVVQLFQPYRLVESDRELGGNQFLGDLFERLLNQGFKQNEGQFFTPNPITRFIWRSLPIEGLLGAEAGGVRYPRIIDYACGAGHFLTEGFEEVSRVALPLDDEYSDTWVRGRLVGVEKDYRLARVSRVALWMHGAGEGEVVFGDGLDSYPDKDVENGGFDILVANPPYSVKAFKPHLKLRNNELSVTEKITDSGSEIETAFVERACQLVAPRGVAAIILPSSILDKGAESFIAARSALLRAFELRAIVRFGSGTFGATGTNTVVLFLRRFDEPPKFDAMCEDAVDAVFESRDLSGWTDAEVLAGYLDVIGSAAGDYKDFVGRVRAWRSFDGLPHFGVYAAQFADSAALKKLRARKAYKAAGPDERQAQEDSLFYETYIADERTRLYVYALVYGQRTLVVNSPTDKGELKEFLGYEWSNRKGDEGIKILSTGGMLYSDDAGSGDATISDVVRAAFEGEEPVAEGLGQLYFFADTAELMDFNAKKFDLAIRAPRFLYRQPSFAEGVAVKRLGDVAAYPLAQAKSGDVSSDVYLNVESMLKDKHGVKAFAGDVPADMTCTVYKPGDVLVANIRPYLKKLWLADRSGACSTDVLVLRSRDEGELLPGYLYMLLWQDDFFNYAMSTAKGIKMPRGDKAKLLDYRVPVPSLAEQRRLVDEFQKLTARIDEKRELAAAAKASVGEKFLEMFGDPVENPMGWGGVELGGCVKSIQSGYSPNAISMHLDDDSFSVLKLSAISTTVFMPSERKQITSADFRPELALRHGDLLLARKNTPELVGALAVVNQDMPRTIFPDIMFRIRARGNVSGTYLAHLLGKSAYTSVVRALASGSQQSMSNIRKTDLETLRIPLPPLVLQQEFADFANEANSRAQALTQEAESLEASRAALASSFTKEGGA